MHEKGILLIVSGPSGSGKGTVVEKLTQCEEYALSISATTREPRNYEDHGTHYFFKEKETFEEMIKNNEFIEYASFCGNYYGTPKSYVEEKLETGYNVILEIEVQGALQIKEKYPASVLIFLMPPSAKELRNRLEGRGTEEKEIIEKRIKRAEEEIEFFPQYDYVVVNDKVGDAVEKIKTIVNAEKLKTSRNIEIGETFKGEI